MILTDKAGYIDRTSIRRDSKSVKIKEKKELSAVAIGAIFMAVFIILGVILS